MPDRVRLFRGRAPTIDADRTASERLLAVAADGEPAVRVWVPHRQVAFGRRDRLSDGYDRAREVAREDGYPPVERDVGGRAVAYDGTTTVAFARADPVADLRQDIDARYDRLTSAVERALSELGVAVERGEPANAFCPGSHSLSAPGREDVGAHASVNGDAKHSRKLVGLAQRVRRDAALGAGIVLVDNREDVGRVLGDVYDALGVTFDPATVGTVADAGGPAQPETVKNVLETQLAGDSKVTVDSVRTLLEDQVSSDREDER